MEIMRRYECRLARLEAFARWWRREQELKRTRPERIAKWMRILAPRYAAAPAPPERDSRRPEWSEGPKGSTRAPVDASGPSPDGSGRQVAEAGELLAPVTSTPPPPAPYLSPPPPPRPLVEFIDRGGGMSIAIDTRTGQMADSATALAALAHMPKEEPDS